MQKIKRNGQITLPKSIREKLNIKDGDYVEVAIEGAEIVVYKLKAIKERV